MRKQLFIRTIICTLLIITSTACSNRYSGVEILISTIPIEDIEELTEWSSHIIRGKVLDSRVEWRDNSRTREQWEQAFLYDGYTDDEIDEMLAGFEFEQREPDLMTIYRIYVVEVFQGAHTAGEIIEVQRLGGEDGYTNWTVVDAIELEIGAEIILFLQSGEWADIEDTLVHPRQGVYYVPSHVDDVEITELEDDELNVELDSVNKFDRLIITLEDLVEIAEYNGLIEPDEIDD